MATGDPHIFFNEGSPSLVQKQQEALPGDNWRSHHGAVLYKHVFILRLGLQCCYDRSVQQMGGRARWNWWARSCLAHCQLNPSDLHGFAVQALILRWSLGSWWFFCTNLSIGHTSSKGPFSIATLVYLCLTYVDEKILVDMEGKIYPPKW